MPGTALILGPSGRFGRNAHMAFCAAGWRVRLFDRTRDDLWDAAWGADVIVNGWNPAYPDWARDLPGQTKQIIEVAEATGATVIVPANVYPYGAGAPECLTPATLHAATNPLGRLRAEMEAAYAASEARVILLRAGDYIDTEASGNWFDKVMVPRLKRAVFTYPGPVDRPHAWAFLPDVARAAVALAERRAELPRFSDLPFAGYTLTGGELHAALEQAWGGRLALKQMSWWPLRMMAPAWPLARHLVEMSYLWRMPHGLDAAPLADLLPGFRPTRLVEALSLAIQHQVDPDKPVTRRCPHRRKAQPA
ncbi:epimerase [Vannielia litorea]|uniref:dTDP-4-dehydrorhamnose reductase n=1 Tax=Vannielia litorea TaxID=1217970 RepID=A0A1N6H6N8_9RHOB|nr:epimerase [Vannielia litorea]SIO15440.1 dTDP-4-dehydrorhamnose reductase [Vannielia litorea]